MKKYPNLCSPIQIGRFTYRNRIEAAPTIFASLALVPAISDRVIRMTEDRAKGGCASVISGEIPVNFDDSLRPVVVGEGKFLNIIIDYHNYTDENFKVFQKNAQSIKKHGAVAIAELSHFGEENLFWTMGFCRWVRSLTQNRTEPRSRALTRPIWIKSPTILPPLPFTCRRPALTVCLCMRSRLVNWPILVIAKQ